MTIRRGRGFGRQTPRPAGAAVAVLLWAPFATVMILSSDARVSALGLAGLAVCPAVGSLLAARAVASGGLGAATAAMFALAAVSTGSLAYGLIFAIIDGHDPFDAFGFALVGLIFLGIPLLIVGFHLALVWVALIRRFA